MSNVILFKNPTFGSLRAVKINGDPWFVAKDVCDCLGFSNVNTVLNYLEDDDKGINIICTPDGDKEMPTVSEAGLYMLMPSSRRRDVGSFRRWLAHEIIPSLRKPGMHISFDDPAVVARAWADSVDREKAERAEKEKAQAALQAEQAAHLDTKRELSILKYKMAELNDEYSDILKTFPIDDMQSAQDMQPALDRYFDTDRRIGDVTFWWFITNFMRVYCHGGVRYGSSGNTEFALPNELQGHFYYVTRRNDVSVFDKRAWADVTDYFERHQDSLKDLPCIGYAVRS